jgi:hypothetical protein
MFKKRLMRILLAGCILCPSLAAEPAREYAGAKGVYPPLVIVPFKSKTLSPPICRMLNQSLMDELSKSAPYKILNSVNAPNLEQFLGRNTTDQLDIYKMKKYAKTRLILVAEAEKEGKSFVVHCRLYDVQNLTLAVDYQQRCDCPFEEVIFWIIPDLVERMKKAKLSIDPACPEGMVTIAAGNFTMGSDEPYDNNPKLQQTHTNYCVDRYEFPNRIGENPATDIAWEDAQQSCEKAGKRLCTDIEWERACRSNYNFTYPYGNNYEKKKCNTDTRKAQKIGNDVDCKSHELVYDMSGNVNEWVGDNWDNNIANKVIRGGGWNSAEENSRCTLRYSNSPDTKSESIGFRCCKTIP